MLEVSPLYLGDGYANPAPRRDGCFVKNKTNPKLFFIWHLGLQYLRALGVI